MSNLHSSVHPSVRQTPFLIALSVLAMCFVLGAARALAESGTPGMALPNPLPERLTNPQLLARCFGVTNPSDTHYLTLHEGTLRAASPAGDIGSARFSVSARFDNAMGDALPRPGAAQLTVQDVVGRVESDQCQLWVLGRVMRYSGLSGGQGGQGAPRDSLPLFMALHQSGSAAPLEARAAELARGYRDVIARMNGG